MVDTRRRLATARGFTLLEVLVALGVSGIATAIFISFFSSSLLLAQTSRNQGVAANLAEEQLLEITHNPGQYDWPLSGVVAGELVEIKPRAAEPNKEHAVAVPGIMPPENAAALKQKNFYEKFEWRAFAQAPEPNAAYVAVHMLIQWFEAGRTRTFSISSCIPRGAVPAQAPAAQGAAK